MKPLIDILNREKNLSEDIDALIREAEWNRDEYALNSLHVEKERKQNELDTVRGELREYLEELFKKGS